MEANQNTPPQGIYGGEVNGANPLEWNLRSTICAQLRAAGFYCLMDAFSDKSGSWINVYKKDSNPSIPKQGKMLQVVISFNYEGSIITGIKLYEESFSLVSGGTSLVW